MSDQHTLLEDETNYRHTLQAYLKHMQQLPPQRKWMSEKLGPRLGEIFNARKELRVLAVGTGSGEVDRDFLNEIVKRGKEQLGDEYSVTYQVVEPNADSIEFFKQSVIKNDNYNKINFQWFHGFLEDFIKEFQQNQNEIEKKGFDFVHYVRCFYHIDSVSGLDKTYNILLRKDGIVAAVGENEGAFWPKMMIFLNDHEMTHECFTCSGPVSMAYFLPGWVSQSEQNKWKYETYTDKYYFDTTLMFDEESKEGNYLIDFCIHAKQSRKTVKKEILDDFFQFLNENIKEEEIVEDDKKVLKKYFPCELGAIIITKE